MNKDAIIERTLNAINQLPLDQAEEISAFAESVRKKYEETELAQGLLQIASAGKTFTFLEEDEEIYALSDLKEVYDGKSRYRTDLLSLYRSERQ